VFAAVELSGDLGGDQRGTVSAEEVQSSHLQLRRILGKAQAPACSGEDAGRDTAFDFLTALRNIPRPEVRAYLPPSPTGYRGV
jgi:hypothetical protein